MLRDDCISLLAERLGKRTDLNTAILLEMVFAQETLLEGGGAFLPWFLETAEATLTCAAGNEELTLPTDYISGIEEHPLWLYDAAADPVYQKIPKRAYATIAERYPDAAKPLYCAITEGAFLLKPTPDAIYSFRLRYKARDVSLTTGNVENKWLKWASDLVLAETGVIMAGRYLQNKKLEDAFKEDALRAWARLYQVHESRQHTGRTYGMGED